MQVVVWKRGDGEKEKRKRERSSTSFLQSLRISHPVTDVLLRGVALAVMLLACSHVSDVLVRCPAVELMVLVC